MAGGAPSSLDGFADHGKSEHQVDEVLTCFNHLEKYDFVSWDDDILNRWKKSNMFQITHQTA